MDEQDKRNFIILIFMGATLFVLLCLVNQVMARGIPAPCSEEDGRLVQRVIEVESRGNPRAKSPRGAIGLMQVTCPTGRIVARQLDLPKFKCKDLFDPVINQLIGTTYLLEQIHRFNSVKLGVAAYNAGPGAVRKYNGVPPYKETRQYVRKVLGL